MAYFLAVDAGGTKTEFLLAEDDRQLGRVIGGTIKRLVATEEQAEASLDQALARLAVLTGVAMDQVTRTCIGTSGNSVPLVADWLRENFAYRISGELLIVGDVEIALDAVFCGERGVLALAGTGSNVAARGQDGRIFTVGGWGPMLADQAAGHWIGLEALRRGFLAIDERRSTPLLEKARAFWRLPSVEALIQFANAEPRPRFADLTPIVVESADQGDSIALAILEQGGRELAYLVELAIERILAGENRALALPAVAVAGSILGKVKPVRNALRTALGSRFPEIRFIDEPSDPVLGALFRARRVP